MVAERRITACAPPLTPVCKILIIVNVAVFFLTTLLGRLAPDLGLQVAAYLWLWPAAVIEQGYVWQLGTSVFLHANLMHLLFNMLGLYMFGGAVERHLGTRRFTWLYVVGGLTGSVCTVILGLVGRQWNDSLYYVGVLGASGAVFAVLIVFAAAFPDATVLFGCLIPMSARVMAVIVIGIQVYYLVSAEGGSVAYSAHLGGALGGWLYFKSTQGRPRGVIRLRRRRRPRRPKESDVIDARFREILRDD